MGAKTLVIVESAAKAKTIAKFLGKNYRVKASVGHIRDLPKSKLGVDIENGFIPQYVTIRGKGEIIKEIKEESENVERVLLATDPDREGEAIAWHLAQVINLDYNRPCRIEFNEITKEAVQKALKRPRAIDMDRVNAQQARRVLDRLVGYSLSPLLWAKVRKGLSAGRVQSVAVRLICEREKEIAGFVPEEYWTIEVLLQTEQGKVFAARLHQVGGAKPVIPDEKTAKELEEIIKNTSFAVNKIERREKKRKAPAPFITSTLQQEAARKLGFTSTRTMRVAQELYEGVGIGEEGNVGLITYIRTDSPRVAQEAQQEALSFIKERFGEAFVPEEPNVYKSKRTAQDAHEAIRPTSVRRTPEELKAFLTRDQHRLYQLIWNRFLASQMASAVYDTVTADITGGDITLRAASSVISFPGHLAVYKEDVDEGGEGEEEKDRNKPKDSKIISALKPQEKLGVKEVIGEQHFTQPPPRYSEASLVKALEEKNIGRPSTYAPIIETIIKRGYVERQSKQLVPTELGFLVVDLLVEHFPEIMDVEFTAAVEENLDLIEEGEKGWQETLQEFYHPFSQRLEQAKASIEKIVVPVQPAGKECKLCGRPMVIRTGRFGKFMACSGFPECRHTESINEGTGVACPLCGGEVVVLRTKKGKRFYGCSNYPQCEFKSWNKPGEEGQKSVGNKGLKSRQRAGKEG